MLREQTFPEISEFMRYLANNPEAERGLPPLKDLSEELGISVASLREQLEVARALRTRGSASAAGDEAA